MTEAAFLNERMKVLKKCLEECMNGQIGVFLEEVKIRTRDGAILNTMELSRRMTERAGSIVRITEKYTYLDLEFEYERDSEALAIHNMFSQYTKRCTELLTNLKAGETINFYTLSFNIVKKAEQDNAAYRITFVNPIFSSLEGSTLKFVFDIDTMDFGIDDVDYEKIKREIEYEQKSREEEAKKSEERRRQMIRGMQYKEPAKPQEEDDENWSDDDTDEDAADCPIKEGEEHE